jgi:hypothetical protein
VAFRTIYSVRVDGMAIGSIYWLRLTTSTCTVSSQLGFWAASIYCKHTCSGRTLDLISRCPTIRNTFKMATAFIGYLYFVIFLNCILQKCSVRSELARPVVLLCRA